MLCFYKFNRIPQFFTKSVCKYLFVAAWQIWEQIADLGDFIKLVKVDIVLRKHLLIVKQQLLALAARLHSSYREL